MAYVIGPIIGAILCNSSIVSWFNYATPFLFTSIGSFVLVVMVSKLLYENHNLDEKNIQINFYEQINIFKNLSNIIKNTSVKWILVSSSFLSLSIMTYYEFFPIILASSWKMSSIYIAYMTAIYSISLCIGALYLPSFLNKRYSKNVSILCILVIMIIGYFLLITDYITLVYLQFVILGLAYGAVNNLMMVMLSDEARPDQQGEVLGFRMSFAMLGSAIICLVGGLIISLSVKIVILLCCIFTLVSILAIVFLTNYHSESN
ncbi:MFS transporter [Francisella sp. Scap27]|uniref:MFS transporter n=1 Tax=Francisella sp. Scap27 TaxID=2589986 RepID=UPI0015BD7DEC|nr:MFS transporter [Francisella sp. Scap27]